MITISQNLPDHLAMECENICLDMMFEYGYSETLNQPLFKVSILIDGEEGQLTDKEYLEKLEYVHNEIAASIHRYKESL